MESNVRAEPTGLRRKVLHSLKWVAGAKIAGQLMGWVITFFVIRILTPRDYGLMAIAEIFIGFAAMFREVGLFSAMVQKRTLGEEEVRQVFGVLIILNCSICVVVVASAPLMARLFGDPRITDVLRVLAFQFPLAALGVVEDAMLNRRMQFKARSLASLATATASAVATLILALIGAGVWALVFGSLVNAVVRPVAFSVATHHVCRPTFHFNQVGALLRFGGTVTVGQIMWYLYSRSDVFIIGKLLGSEALGIYSVALQLATLPMQKVAEFLGQVGYTAYASIQNDLPALRFQYMRVIRMLALVSFPVFWGISVVAPEIINVALGERWKVATTPLVLLSLIMPIRMIGHTDGDLLSAINKPRLYAFGSGLTLMVMVPSILVGTAYYGLAGAAVAWILGYSVLAVARLGFVLPAIRLPIKQYVSAVMRPMLCAGAMYGVVLAMRTMLWNMLPGLELMVVLMFAGAGVYCALMWLVARRDCQELIGLARSARRA